MLLFKKSTAVCPRLVAACSQCIISPKPFNLRVLLALQVLCRNSGSTLGYGFATLMEDNDDSSSEEDEPLRPMSLTEAIP